MHLGVIYVAYQAEDLVESSLAPWLVAKRAQLGGHTYTLCAVSVPFEGFPQEGEPDRTHAILGTYAQAGEVDHVIVRDKPMKETEARGAALRWLVGQGATVTWQVDSDEVYTQDDIARIAAFVEANPWVMSYRLSLRNAVFDDRTFLVEPFQPMRVHRTHSPGGHIADGFYNDNNACYTRPWERDKMSCPVVLDTQMASMIIPPSTAFVKHMSWLSNPRSKAKITYQLGARGWPECSFRWDDAANELRFNEAYYARRGLPLPEVTRD